MSGFFPPSSPPAAPPPADNGTLKWIGLFFYATSVLMTNMALLIMKRSTATENNLPFRKRKTFIMGWFLNLISEVAFSNVALALAPLAMLAPVAGIGIPAAAIFARTGWFGPKEFLTPIECFGGCITISGVVLASIFGPRGDEPNLRDLPPVFGEALFLAFALPQFAFVAGYIALMRREAFAKYRPPDISSTKAFLSAYSSGFLIRRAHHYYPVWLSLFTSQHPSPAHPPPYLLFMPPNPTPPDSYLTHSDLPLPIHLTATSLPPHCHRTIAYRTCSSRSLLSP